MTGRDKAQDPRREARAILEQRRYRTLDIGVAAIWGILHVGDAIHRAAKALEADLPEDEVAARRFPREDAA